VTQNLPKYVKQTTSDDLAN